MKTLWTASGDILTTAPSDLAVVALSIGVVIAIIIVTVITSNLFHLSIIEIYNVAYRNPSIDILTRIQLAKRSCRKKDKTI